MKEDLARNVEGDVVVILEQETLSDNSKVFNVLLLGDCGRVKVQISSTSLKSAEALYNKLTNLAHTCAIDIDSIR